MAESLLQEGCDLCAQIGYRRLWDESYALQALVFHHSGRFKDAADIWADVYRSAQRRDDPQPMIWGLVGKTEGGLLLNEDAGEFMNHLKEAESLLAAENLSSAEFIRTHGMLARAYLRLGNFDLAGQEAEKTLEFITATKFFLPYAFEGYVAPAEVYLTLWEIAGDQVSIDNDSAANLAWQGLKTARKMGRTFPVFEPRAWLYQGRFDWLSGRPEKAQMAWQKSIDLAQELGMPHEEGLAHYEAGRHLPPGDIDGDRHLQRAIKLFSDLEAAYHLNLAREALTVPA
jgi:tetratricopeptide (TPR) repeat protein